MNARTTCVLLLAMAVAPHVAVAADDSLQQLHAEIQELKQSYEARLRQLEERVAQAEAAQRAASAPPAPTPSPAPAAVPATAPGPAAAGAATANAFNPAVSVILAGGYTSLSQDPNQYRLTGFLTSSDVGPGPRGLSLAESELSLAASVDPYFSGVLTVSITPENTVSVEEAFFQTTAIGNGVQLKGGRFLSGIGYLNGQHSHVWDFVDTPLAYQAFLGGQFGQDGLQLHWVAPTDTFIELGAEIGSGRDFPATPNNGNGVGAAALTGHLGGDVGFSNSWRFGLSYLSASPSNRSSDGFDANGNAVRNVFSGDSRTWLADVIWKWAPNGNAVQRNLKLQAEAFQRHESGTLVFDADGTAASGSYASTQWGAYAQAVYQFVPRWSTGLRYDRLDRGSIDFAAADPSLLAPPYNPSRWTAMLSFAPSEFSRLRMQFAADRSRPGVTDNQFRIDYQMSLGAHGAHSY